MRVKIEKIGINGEGIGFDNKQPIFIEGAIPQEVVDIDIIDKQRTYSRGQVTKLITRSEDRVNKPCRYANECGACSFMHINYAKQLQFKYDLLRESLIKYAQVNPRLIHKIVKNSNPLGYRNSFKLPFSMVDNKIACGLYKPGSNYFVPVETCLIHDEGLERIKKQLLVIFNKYKLVSYDYRKKEGLRTLIMRGFNGKYQCCVVTGETPLPVGCIEECMQIEGLTSLWQNYNTLKKTIDLFGKVMIHLGGDKLITFDFKGLNLILSPRSFFQLNTAQAEKLYDVVADMVPNDNELIVEAYSGVGTISLTLSDKADEIIGIESINDAVYNANQNAKRNKITNVSFVCGDAAEKLTLIAKRKKVNTLIVDPPRSGLDENMMDCILKSRIKNIIYISCNPSTLGKNIAVLQKFYKVEKVVPLDMFSNTAHVESIVKLVRK